MASTLAHSGIEKGEESLPLQVLVSACPPRLPSRAGTGPALDRQPGSGKLIARGSPRVSTIAGQLRKRP